MVSNTSEANKTQGTEQIDKSAVVVVEIPGSETGLTLDATHVITNASKQIIYLGNRSDGIDFIVTERTVVARSARAEQLLAEQQPADAHTGTDNDDSDGEPNIVTDGGRPRGFTVTCEYCTAGMSVQPETDKPDQGWKCNQCRRLSKAGERDAKSLRIIETADAEPGDRVKYDGRDWTFIDFAHHHIAELVPIGHVRSGETVVRTDVRDLDPVTDTDSNDPYADYDAETDGRDETRLVTDGGRDTDESVEVLDCRTPPAWRHAPATVDVAVGDKATMGAYLLEVTDVERDGELSAKITVEHGEFKIVIEDGVWQCQRCERLVAGPFTGTTDICDWCFERKRKLEHSRPDRDDGVEGEDAGEVLI